MTEWKTRIRETCANAGHVLDEDVLEELSLHASSEFQKVRAGGMDEAEALRHVEAIVEAWSHDPLMLCRRPRRPPLLESPSASTRRLTGLAADLRYALRLCARQPGFALLVVLTMALGIAATSTLFSVVHGVLLKPLPWPHADQLIRLTETRQGSTRPMPGTMTNATYLPWRDGASTIDGLAAWSPRTMTLTGSGDAQRVRVVAITASLFPLLGASPVMGTRFEAQSEVPGSDSVVISYGFWERELGRDQNVLGRKIQLDGRGYTIVAVMPRDFAFPDRLTRAWVPFYIPPLIDASGNGRALSMFNAMARLRPGTTASQAAAEATARGRSGPDAGLVAIAVFGSNGPIEVSAAPALDSITGEVRRPMLLLMLAVGLLLITATANVASLQLARATVRRREIAIRAAIGAGAARLMRQILIENLLLGLCGGLVGLALSGALHSALPSLAPPDFPRLDDVTLDSNVLGFTALISILTALGFGLLPAIRLRRMNLAESLSQGVERGDGTGLHTARTRVLIMAGQVAIASLLLIGAGLLVRSFYAMLHADRGFDSANLLTARLPMPATLYPASRRAAIIDGVLMSLRQTDGVGKAAYTDSLPLTGSESRSSFIMRRPGADSPVNVSTLTHTVSHDYFAALGIRIVEGRGFTESDTAASPHVAVVNRAFAQKYLGSSPVGARLPAIGNWQTDCEVVGVSENVIRQGIGDDLQPALYLLQPQTQVSAFSALVIRVAGEPRTFIESLKAAVKAQDPSLALESVMTMEDRIGSSLARPRLYAVILGGFALFALIIAGVGLFGVLSYSVAQRSTEIAVRTAVGARPLDIACLILREAFGITVSGLVIGIGSALILVSYLSTLLYGVRVYDALTFVSVPLILCVITLLACALPSLRAIRIDPIRGMRGKWVEKN